MTQKITLDDPWRDAVWSYALSDPGIVYIYDEGIGWVRKSDYKPVSELIEIKI
jgi:hypothetical protein